MKNHLFKTIRGNVLCWGLSLGLGIAGMAANCPGQAPAVALPSGVQDVVRLVKAGLAEDVILAQINKAGAHYDLSVDQIIYLHDQGVTQSEIKALLSGPPAPATPAVPAIPAPPVAVPANPAPVQAPLVPLPGPAVPPGASLPPAVATGAPVAPVAESASLESFRAQLAPYGTWMEVPGFGLCWRPSAEVGNPYWRPYCDQGQWVYTENGWFWKSDVPWGDIAFHYGRWYRDPSGWVWVPAYDWAPAWVTWRHADGYCGWAPLPPAAVFRAGVGLWYGGRVAVDVDFGLGVDAFTFVSYDRFWEHNLHAFLLPRERLEIVFGRSVIMNGYRVERGRFIVEGLGRERMARLTHREVVVEHVVAHDARIRAREPERRVIREDRRERRER